MCSIAQLYMYTLYPSRELPLTYFLVMLWLAQYVFGSVVMQITSVSVITELISVSVLLTEPNPLLATPLR